MINPKTLQVYSDIQGGKPPLKAIREALGLNQAEFAVKLGTAVSTVSRWENHEGKKTFTIEQILILQEMLKEVGLTLEALVDPQDNPSN